MRTPLLAPVAALFLVAATTAVPAAVRSSGLDFEPHAGARLPLALRLFDEGGRGVMLGQYFAGQPVVLVLDYLRCKAFCGLTLRGLVTALDALPLDAGRDYQVVIVSIDPRDTPADAAAQKAKYLAAYDRPDGGVGWHFLTGPKAVVTRIADAVGFPYRYDPATDQYLHPAGFVVAAPNGTISRYILAVDPAAPQLQAALLGAGRAKAENPVMRFLLWCSGQDALSGRRAAPIMTAFAIADIAAIAALSAIFAVIRGRRSG